MLIKLKNKDTLIIDDFKLKCCVGKKGIKIKGPISPDTSFMFFKENNFVLFINEFIFPNTYP